MEEINFLLLNFLPVRCHEGNCGNFVDLIKNCFPHSNIQQWKGEQGQDLHPRLESSPKVIFLRLGIKGIDGHELKKLRKAWPDVPLLGIVCEQSTEGGFFDRNLLVGLDDFLCCPITRVDIELRAFRHLKIELSSNAIDNVQWENSYTQNGLLGDSMSFRRSLEKIPTLAESEATVLVCGETGTGKELFARAIHYCGPRRKHPFIPINCGALPDHLFENELFGHTKGAFTDASSEQNGLIQEAENGTLFLDEIDALTPTAQVKLLRFLQNGDYRPLGSSKILTANVRVVAATNQDLRSFVQERRFRDDLYFRLNTLCLFIPPLRERIEDIALLAKHFLAHYVGKTRKQGTYLTTGAIEKLRAYNWPGNVRELESVIERSVTFNTAMTLLPCHIDFASPGSISVETTQKLNRAKKSTIEQFERTYLIEQLASHNGNVSHAAKGAGTDRRTFQRLLRKHGVDRNDFIQKV